LSNYEILQIIETFANDSSLKFDDNVDNDDKRGCTQGEIKAKTTYLYFFSNVIFVTGILSMI